LLQVEEPEAAILGVVAEREDTGHLYLVKSLAVTHLLNQN
jgi:hypothetical protein